MEYITFVLGYDLLKDRFEALEDAPCDNAWEVCKMIAREFTRMDALNPLPCSQYEALQVWLEHNTDFVDWAFYYYGLISKEAYYETVA